MTPSTQSPGEGELIARLQAYAESNPDTGWNGELRVGPMMLRGACSSAADTIERLSERLVRMEEERRLDREALLKIATWRLDCHAYDADKGCPPRPFGDDDFMQIEAYAHARLSRQPPKEQP